MKILWEYPLPTPENCSGHWYEGPIHTQGKWLYYVSCHPHMLLHIVDTETGTGTRSHLSPANKPLPSDCFFLPFGEDVLLYCGDLIRLRDGQVQRDLPIRDRGSLVSHLVTEDRLYLVFKGTDAGLVCVDMAKLHILWETDLKNTSYYTVGPVTFFGDRLACFGQDKLLFLDPDTGAILDSLKLPRIGKLFQPTPLPDGRLLLGFTNWSNAGVLCMDTATKKILWRHKRSFEGPLLRCRLWLQEDRVFWVKNDTELCCVSLEDGAELYRQWTDPWLYTPLELAPEGVIFGTAGADGFLYCLDPKTGAERWKHPMKDGCVFYAHQEDTLFTGDCTNRLFRIRASDGAILQTLDTGTEVVGQFHCRGDSLYTVLWCDDSRPCRLIRVEI